MKTLFTRKRDWIVALLLVWGLTGCSVVPEPTADLTRFYVLSNPRANGENVALRSNALQIGLKRVEVSPYLDKGSLVVRHGDNELVYNDYARWAEPIGAGVSRIVRSRLLDNQKIGRVFVDSFPFDQSRDYDISIYVTRCEGALNTGETRFAAVVEVTTTGENARVVARREFIAPSQAWNGKNYAALVAGLSEAVDALSNQIVALLP